MWNPISKFTLYGCVVSVCCVGFTSLGVVCDELNIGPEMLVCSSFLICVGMLVLSKALLISDATVIVGARGAICLKPFDIII